MSAPRPHHARATPAPYRCAPAPHPREPRTPHSPVLWPVSRPIVYGAFPSSHIPLVPVPVPPGSHVHGGGGFWENFSFESEGSAPHQAHPPRPPLCVGAAVRRQRQCCARRRVRLWAGAGCTSPARSHFDGRQCTAHHRKCRRLWAAAAGGWEVRRAQQRVGWWKGGWVARCAGGGGREFWDFPGRIPAQKSAPRAARPPHPPRVPGARRGRMGPEVGPAFQRRSGDTIKLMLGVRFGGNGVQTRGLKKKGVFVGILIVESRIKSTCFPISALSAFCHEWEQDTWEIRPSRRDLGPARRALRARK
eukprot:gene21988-biopygen2695